MPTQLTEHANKRAQQRGFSMRDIADVLHFGRKQYAKGAVYYSIGKKEIKKYQQQYMRLKNMNGMHVVMGGNGSIITVFRNANFHAIY